MASVRKNLLWSIKSCTQRYAVIPRPQVRYLTSKQLVYSEFGDPLHVVKIRECPVRSLGDQEVLVRMLAAPVNPADINTIQGNKGHPPLPHVPGDEGVGEVLEIDKNVSRVKPGQRVIITTKLLGTWRYYGIYHEKDVQIISSDLPLPEASVVTVAPCSAYAMIKNFRYVRPGETIIQNAANSSCGQFVIQLCKAWDIKTLNIVSCPNNFKEMKKYLLSIGATAVVTLEQAEKLKCFNTSLGRPVLALNCLGGRYEDIMLKLLKPKGSIVYYGCANRLPSKKQFLRTDACFHQFSVHDWISQSKCPEKSAMLNEIIHLMLSGKLKAPLYQPIELKNYVYAFRNTGDCEAFTTMNYIFDFTV